MTLHGQRVSVAAVHVKAKQGLAPKQDGDIWVITNIVDVDQTETETVEYRLVAQCEPNQTADGVATTTNTLLVHARPP